MERLGIFLPVSYQHGVILAVVELERMLIYFVKVVECHSSNLTFSSSSIFRFFTASSPSSASNSFRRFRLSAGPSPNRQIGWPNCLRSFLICASSVDTFIIRIRFLRSNSANISLLPSSRTDVPISKAMYSLDVCTLSALVDDSAIKKRFLLKIAGKKLCVHSKLL